MGRKPKPLPSDARKIRPASPLHVPVKLSYALYQSGERFCLCFCDRDEVRIYMDCLRMLSQMTWDQIRGQGGKPGNKVGLAFTPYEDHSLKVARPAQVSPDLKISGIRAGGKLRLFGVVIEQVFYVLWFDRNHDIVDG